MRLYKNVDIKDLKNILTKGLLPISITSNDNWENNNRSNNPTDVVYLFEPLNQGDSFVEYGLALIEVEVENATVNQMTEADVNKDFYIEHIVSEVKPSQITNVYIPSFVTCGDSRITKVDYTCSYFKATGRFSCELVNLDGNARVQFEKTASTSTGSSNYLRGTNSDGTMIDTKNWSYNL